MKYDVVVLGGGSGGLVVASGAAQVGLRVLLIEKHRLGGDCLWTGCVPSKALIASAKLAHMGGGRAEALKHIRISQKAIEPHDSPERFRKMGVHVVFGEAAFTGRRSLKVNGEEHEFRYGVIATGGRPRIPDIDGVDESDILTSEDIFNVKRLPESIVMIGGGPINMELAQALTRLKSSVTVVARSSLLNREDEELVGLLRGYMESEGVKFVLGCEPVKLKGKRLFLRDEEGNERSIRCDKMLFAAVGRMPNVEGLDLERAGVQFSEGGIVVDECLRTSNKRIYAIGDVLGREQFTHLAASHAGTVLRNIMTPFVKSSAEERVIPRVTFTDPELATVGEIPSGNKGEVVLSFDLSDLDRAITDGRPKGKMKVVIDGKGRILGASILSLRAGEMIMEYALAMKNGLKIQDIASTIHPYPTYSSASWTLAGSYYKRLLTPRTKKLLRFLVRRF